MAKRLQAEGKRSARLDAAALKTEGKGGCGIWAKAEGIEHRVISSKQILADN